MRGKVIAIVAVGALVLFLWSRRASAATVTRGASTVPPSRTQNPVAAGGSWPVPQPATVGGYETRGGNVGGVSFDRSVPINFATPFAPCPSGYSPSWGAGLCVSGMSANQPPPPPPDPLELAANTATRGGRGAF